jgi:ABC-type multidrug transport system fused ATPase/permease subunit
MLLKYYKILSESQKWGLLKLALVLFVGMLFEIFGIGILLPCLNVLINPQILNKWEVSRNLINFLGNPTQNELIVMTMSFLLGVFIIKTIYLTFSIFYQSSFSGFLSKEISERLFNGYLFQPYIFHLNRNSANLINNIQQEVAGLMNLTQSILVLVTEFSVVVGIVVMLIFVEPLGAFSVILILAISIIIFHTISKQKLLTWGALRQTLSEAISKSLMQGIGGIKDAKILGREEYFSKSFSQHNKDYFNIYVKSNTLSLFPRLYLELLAVVGIVSLIFIMMIQGKPVALVLPTLGIFAASAFRLIPSANRVLSSIQAFSYYKPVVEKLYSEFDEIMPEVKVLNDRSNSSHFNDFAKININQLSYSYDGKAEGTKVLSNVSFEILKGQSIGIIGQSGAGKSTLVDLILGLLTPTEGNINLDGIDIQSNLKAWQSQIGYVPQTIYLTDDSLRKNIAFGVEENLIDEAAVQLALKLSQLATFINELPNGLETIVGERGVKLSGGQRQRIGIARALYHQPNILVLDEATSALDNETEKNVMQSIYEMQGDKTILIIAHRLSTIENCDKVLKFEKGHLTN